MSTPTPEHEAIAAQMQAAILQSLSEVYANGMGDAHKVLTAIEWGGNDEHTQCPCCRGSELYGHDEACALRAVLDCASDGQ